MRFDVVRDAVQHVEEVGVAADVQLVGVVELDAAVREELRQHAVHDGGAELRLDVVADDGNAPALEFRRPLRVGGDEHRDAVDHRDAGLEAGARVVLGGELAAHRQVVDDDLGAALPEHLRDVDRTPVGDQERPVIRVVGHVLCDTVEHVPHLAP